MTWEKHPKYKKAKAQFISEISVTSLNNLHYHLPRILFICGGDPKYFRNREILESYIRKHNNLYLTFRAEYAWETISKAGERHNLNALSLEEWLADFSDVVLILVESFGTVAEFGAFSSSPALRKKLLPILEKNFERDESFINTGPVRWVNNESRYAPCIYTNFKTVLTCIPEIEERINIRAPNISSNDNTNGKYKFTRKVLLFFTLQIIASLGPISTKEIIEICSEIINFKDRKTISLILSLGVALEIFESNTHKEEQFFSCHDFEKLFRHQSTQSLLHRIQRSRTRALSSLLSIDDYRAVLRKAIENAS